MPDMVQKGVLERNEVKIESGKDVGVVLYPLSL